MLPGHIDPVDLLQGQEFVQDQLGPDQIGIEGWNVMIGLLPHGEYC